MTHVQLIGAEAVERAAGQMRQAATELHQTVANMESIFDQQRRFMDDWLLRFEDALQKKGTD